MLSILEHHFRRDRYCTFMTKYAALGHMSKVKPLLVESQRRGCNLPHHGVLQGSESETKIRIVFNGSSPVAGGFLIISLHAGPNRLPSPADVITRWPDTVTSSSPTSRR